VRGESNAEASPRASICLAILDISTLQAPTRITPFSVGKTLQFGTFRLFSGHASEVMKP
jgi:hypothetical protein